MNIIAARCDLVEDRFHGDRIARHGERVRIVIKLCRNISAVDLQCPQRVALGRCDGDRDLAALECACRNVNRAFAGDMRRDPVGLRGRDLLERHGKRDRFRGHCERADVAFEVPCLGRAGDGIELVALVRRNRDGDGFACLRLFLVRDRRAVAVGGDRDLVGRDHVLLCVQTAFMPITAAVIVRTEINRIVSGFGDLIILAARIPGGRCCSVCRIHSLELCICREIQRDHVLRNGCSVIFCKLILRIDRPAVHRADQIIAGSAARFLRNCHAADQTEQHEHREQYGQSALCSSQ